MAQSLYSLPGLGAFYQAADRNADASARDLRSAMQVIPFIEKARRERQLEQMAALAGGDPEKLMQGFLQAGDPASAARVAQVAEAQGALQGQRAQRQFFTPENVARFTNQETGALDMDAMMRDALGAGAVNAQTYVQHAQSVQQRREAAAERTRQAIAQMEQKRQELELRMQDRALDRESREQMARESRALQAGIANASNALRRDQMEIQRQNLEFQRSRTPAEKPLTDAQANATMYANRAAQAHKILLAVEGDASNVGIGLKQAAERIPLIGGAVSAAANSVMSDATQQTEQAQRNFINAVLRKESGAVISEEEFANARKQYFPMPGDSQAVIRQKRMNRQAAIAGLGVAAGPGLSRLPPEQQIPMAGQPAPAPAPAAPPAGGQRNIVVDY